MKSGKISTMNKILNKHTVGFMMYFTVHSIVAYQSRTKVVKITKPIKYPGSQEGF